MPNENGQESGIDVKQQPIGVRSALLALSTVVMWGANPVAVRFTVDRLPPFTISSIRFWLASGVMALWCLAAGDTFKLRRDQLTPVLVCGVYMYLQIGLFTVGCAWSNASHTSLIVNSFALGVVLIEHFVTRAERLNAVRGAGVALATMGLPLIFLAANADADRATGDLPSVRGDLVLLCSAALLSLKVVYTKRVVRRVPVGTLIFWHDVVGASLLTVTAIALEEVKPGPWGLPCLLGLAYQGLLVAGLCFGIQAYLLSRHGATQVTVFNFATPLVGVGAGVLLRDDPFSSWLALAGACIAAGILIVNQGGKVRKAGGRPG